MKSKKGKNQTPLTLEGLVSYNQEVLFPFLKDNFVSKKEFTGFKNEMSGFKSEMSGFKNEMNGFKNEMSEFKNETLSNFDSIEKKLDILLTEKEVRQYQEEKQKKLWLVVIKALKKHNILSSEELGKISRLEIF